MKKLLFTIIFITSISHSQNKFIEIEVRDTIRLEASKYEYHIELTESFEYMGLALQDEEYDLSFIKENKKMKLFQLKEFLVENNYDFKSFNDNNYKLNNNPYFTSNGYKITLNSLDEVSSLVTKLKKFDFINGNIANVTFIDNDASERKLFEKLISKAKKKAQMIAEISGQKIGNIIQFTEVKEIDDFTFNFMDIYLTSQSTRDWNFNDNFIFGEKSKAIIVKFETE